ncbi:MAG: polysaccharide pyruvyl transferase CsaB [Candidatus Obscuribacterales bacterium]|nr:polysaccharide pyruvyl transferase CsaB [Candidatus Obscuribacterales bacterium]
MERSLVFVSGYYGFDNLGDEAILEELCSELKQLVKPEDIVVLSQEPERTAAKYGVRALKRQSYSEIWNMLGRARLLVSGGGGLFQNTKTLGSIIFYGLQILMAKSHRAAVVIYAQGIGPLRGAFAPNLCRTFFAQADAIAVRDDASMKYLQSWGLTGERTADPVWRLEASELPASIKTQLQKVGAAAGGKSRAVGVSLRPSAELTEEHLRQLAKGLAALLSKDEYLLLLPLQPEQDSALLQSFQNFCNELSLKTHMLDTSELVLPSQWLSVFSELKFLVGMRLHAMIMTLKSGRPVAGIAYDPKVTQLLAEFEQCCLILTKESAGKDWGDALKTFASGLNSFSSRAKSRSEAAKKLACQNFDILARILGMPRD